MEAFKERLKGGVTVFLSLIFLVLFSLVGALIESVSLNLARNNRRMELELALESVFAEYDKELLEKYEVFALDGTYGGGDYDEQKILDRLKFYGASETENKVHSVELLTDNQGTPFYRLATQYMRNQYGLPEDAKETESTWKDMAEQSQRYLNEVDETNNQMTEKLLETEESLPEEGNPLVAVEEVKKQGLIRCVLPEEVELSGLSIKGEQRASQRRLKEGTYPQSEEMDVVHNVLFHEYLLEQFPRYAKGETIAGLSYGVEYLLCGNEKEEDNLEAVLQKILLLRVVPNYVYLQTDSAKKAEVKALATSLCSALQVGGAAPIVEQVLLLAWAYGESVAELQVLMDGGKIATVKKDTSWILSLAELPLVGTSRHTKEEGEENGMDYEAYLRALLLLTPTKKLTMRALDLVEVGTDLKADCCVTRIQIASTCYLRRENTYEFRTQYAYR